MKVDSAKYSLIGYCGHCGMSIWRHKETMLCYCNKCFPKCNGSGHREGLAELIQEWLDEDSDHDIKAWPEMKAVLEKYKL